MVRLYKSSIFIIMDTTKNEFQMTTFRNWGILFFFTGAVFHCIDFIGTEKTLEWAMGQMFLAGLLLSSVFWIRKAIKNQVWNYF